MHGVVIFTMYIGTQEFSEEACFFGKYFVLPNIFHCTCASVPV